VSKKKPNHKPPEDRAPVTPEEHQAAEWAIESGAAEAGEPVPRKRKSAAPRPASDDDFGSPDGLNYYLDSKTKDPDNAIIRKALAEEWEAYDPDAPDEIALARQSVTLADFTLDDLIDEPIPADADDDTLFGLAAKYHVAITQYGRKLADLGIKLGGIYRMLRPKYPYGTWEKKIKGEQERGGPGISTVKRYMRLAAAHEDDPEPARYKKLTLMQAYRRAGIIDDQASRTENVPHQMGLLIEKLGEIKKQVVRIQKQRRSLMDQIPEGDLEEDAPGIVSIYYADVTFNQALNEIVKSINVCEYHRLYWADHLREWLKDTPEEVVVPITPIAPPPECVPDLSPENLAAQWAKQHEEKEQHDKFERWREEHMPRREFGFMNRKRFPHGPSKQKSSRNMDF
jgi:hypothetical protein